ncbi:hypothetical protein QUA74_22830 [Microcoleus sp. LAD1_D3]
MFLNPVENVVLFGKQLLLRQAQSMEIQDPMIRDRVAQIVQRLLGEL